AAPVAPRRAWACGASGRRSSLGGRFDRDVGLISAVRPVGLRPPRGARPSHPSRSPRCVPFRPSPQGWVLGGPRRRAPGGGARSSRTSSWTTVADYLTIDELAAYLRTTERAVR